MKAMYNINVDEVFYKYNKYTPNPKPEPISRLIYKNDIQRFLDKLNELEKEFGFTIASDYSEDHDGIIEARLDLYDNEYGLIGEILEEEGERDEED